jgi:hypothetical protein
MVENTSVNFILIPTSNLVVDPPYTIYMGRDKYESKSLNNIFLFLNLSLLDNELLKHCWPEDIWFVIELNFSFLQSIISGFMLVNYHPLMSI